MKFAVLACQAYGHLQCLFVRLTDTCSVCRAYGHLQCLFVRLMHPQCLSGLWTFAVLVRLTFAVLVRLMDICSACLSGLLILAVFVC